MMKGWRSHEGAAKGCGEQTFWCGITSKTSFLRRQLNRRRTAPTATVRGPFMFILEDFTSSEAPGITYHSMFASFTFPPVSHFRDKKDKNNIWNDKYNTHTLSASTTTSELIQQRGNSFYMSAICAGTVADMKPKANGIYTTDDCP